MTTPLIIFKNIFPQEIIDKIQIFLVNGIPCKAIQIEFNKTIKKELLYGRFVYFNYIIPNCSCYNKVYPKMCKWCYKYNHTYYYTNNKWYIYFINNDQLEKITNYL